MAALTLAALLLLLAIVRALPSASTSVHGLQVVQPDHDVEPSTGLQMQQQQGARLVGPLVEPFQIFAAGSNATTTCGVVISAYGTNLTELRQLRQLLPAHCSVMVYDKGPETARCHASRIPPEMRCAADDNKENDWNPTWLKYVQTHYDVLPALVIAVPSNSVAKHRRFQRLVSACADAKFGADGGGGGNGNLTGGNLTLAWSAVRTRLLVTVTDDATGATAAEEILKAPGLSLGPAPLLYGGKPSEDRDAAPPLDGRRASPLAGACVVACDSVRLCGCACSLVRKYTP